MDLAVVFQVAAVPRGVGRMKCPKCKTHDLIEKKVKNSALTLDRCNKCEGMWFDKGELALVLRKKASTHISIPKISLRNENCRCPRCEEGMYEFCYPETAVFIDMCEKCQGIWLDAKEWTEISTARSEKNKIICPSCNKKQEKSLSCTACGVVFSKLKAKEPSKVSDKTVEKEETINAENHIESYADDIPGIKGQLLRFINRSIGYLTNY